MASRARKPTAAAQSRLRTTAPSGTGPILPGLEAFVLDGEGQISIGAIGPIACAAVASDPHSMLAALVRRPDETLAQLLERLEHALRLALEDDIFTDEINARSSSSRR